MPSSLKALTIIALGNPGDDYHDTRHNTGWIIADFIVGKDGEWQNRGMYTMSKMSDSLDKKSASFTWVKPQTFMNKSGQAAAALIKNAKAAGSLVVIHDDLDLPIGVTKLSFNRGSGGHRGVDSIIKAIKTEAFFRIRVGISPVTPTGKIKKPAGEAKVEKHILSEFSPKEMLVLKKVAKKIHEGLLSLATQTPQIATTIINSN